MRICRFRFAWAWYIGVVLAAPAFAQVTLDRDGGPDVSCLVTPTTVEVTGVLACTPLPNPFCGDEVCNGAEHQCSCAADCGMPPAMETACADSIDDDCDGLTDCADGDCATDPACAPPPAGGEDLGLTRKWRWNVAHRVVCGSDPPQQIGPMGSQPLPGECIHHLLDLAGNATPQEATEPDLEWWPEVEADGIRLTHAENDQLQLMRCTSLDPNVCEEQPWTVSATTPWVLVFVGELSGAAAITGCNMTGCPSINIIDVTASGVLRIRMANSGRVTLMTTPNTIAFDQPFAFLVEYDGAGNLRAQRRDPCGPWYDATAGTPVNNRAFTVGCISCYYPNGWINELGTEEPHYPGLGLLREFRIHEADPVALRADLQSYLDAEHGEWIDAECGP